MKRLVLVSLFCSIFPVSAFAETCEQFAGKIAKHLDAVSTNQSPEQIEVISSIKIKSDPGKHRDRIYETYQVQLAAENTALASVYASLSYEIDLYIDLPTKNCWVENIKRSLADPSEQLDWKDELNSMGTM